MSYAGPASRARRAPDGSRDASRDPASSTTASTRSSSPSPHGSIRPSPSFTSGRRGPALFAAGVAIGVVVGAGVALLLAPQAGADTRQALVRRSRRLSHRGRDVWDEFGYELRRALKRKLAARRRRKLADDPDAA
jgi:hypothetical protein